MEIGVHCVGIKGDKDSLNCTSMPIGFHEFVRFMILQYATYVSIAYLMGNIGLF